MAGRSSQADNRGDRLLGFSVSGKGKEFHTFRSAKRALPPGIEATGGTITNIQDGGNNYKVHTFTASGSFVVSDLGSLTSNIEYLVVAGGGSGGQNLSGGGGAGGLRTNLSGHPLAAPSYPVSVGTYTVTIGAGGASQSSHEARGNNGSNTEFYPNPVSYPNSSFIRSVGGGGGAGGASGPTRDASDGGSGGGAPGYAYAPNTGAAGNTPTDPNHPKVQGYAGGDNDSPPYGSNYIGGGGGGAGGVGLDGDSAGDSPNTGNGGPGVQVDIDGNNYYWAGGGGAASYTNADADQKSGAGGIGGGGGGGSNSTTYGAGGGSALNSGGTATNANGGNGGENTGSGGGGCAHNNGPASGSGGKGIVIIRYQVP